jgi:hypothetical protein
MEIDMAKSKDKTGRKRHFSPLDLFVIILSVLCAAGIFVRLYLGDMNIDGSASYDNGEYAVSFIAEGVDTVYSEHFAAGTVFYLEDGTVFGTMTDGVAITPAQLIVEDEDGALVQVYAAGNGDDSIVDIRGTVTASGTYSPEKGFYIGGKHYAAANKTLTIHSADAELQVLVTDVIKVR